MGEPVRGVEVLEKCTSGVEGVFGSVRSIRAVSKVMYELAPDAGRVLVSVGGDSSRIEAGGMAEGASSLEDGEGGWGEGTATNSEGSLGSDTTVVFSSSLAPVTSGDGSRSSDMDVGAIESSVVEVSVSKGSE